jgi:hypothetical protein
MNPSQCRRPARFNLLSQRRATSEITRITTMQANATQPADAILYGRILTLDEKSSVAQAMVWPAAGYRQSVTGRPC